MFDLITLIKTIGYLGIFGIIFAESGLFIGFFLPGDSLLFTAGFLASQGYLHIHVLALGVFIAAVIGDSVGYAFGRRVGPALFAREDSFFFNKTHITRSHAFFLRHGKKTIVLARFVPIVRTFAPILAGVGTMNYRSFLFYNVLGGLLWAVSLTYLGFFLGSVIPDIDRYLLPIIIGIIFLSLLPNLIALLRDREARGHILNALRRRSSDAEQQDTPHRQ